MHNIPRLKLQGLGESAKVALVVAFPPSCLQSQPVEITAAVHESVDLECQMEAEPRNVTFTWERGEEGNRMEVTGMEFTQYGSRSVLTLTPRTPADFGTVTCSAHSSLGSGTSCVFVVSRTVPLPSVEDCRVEGSEGGLVVKCREETSSPMSSPTSYLARLTNLETGASVEAESESPAFHFQE